MIKIHSGTSFKKAYKKNIKNEKDKNDFKILLGLFAEDPFNPKLKTHKLSGKLKGLYAFSCGYDCRVIFKFLDSENVLLVDIGKHEEVY